MRIFLEGGIVDADLKFSNFNNYSINLSVNQVDLDKIDQLLFLNSRYGGILNGDFLIYEINSSKNMLTNLLITNSKSDDFKYKTFLEFQKNE